jgi:hypothetical protein
MVTNGQICLGAMTLREPLTIQFGVPANLFDSELRQGKAALASTKADSPSLSEFKNLLLSAQKQLLELPLSNDMHGTYGSSTAKSLYHWLGNHSRQEAGERYCGPTQKPFCTT